MFCSTYKTRIRELENLLELMGFRGDNLNTALLECANLRKRLDAPYKGPGMMRADIEGEDNDATHDRIMALASKDISERYVENYKFPERK
ncbi:MAG TPA: hypothetical protein VHP58_02375 [Alphaproteobacteria bacterium]|nr:hypothetical protein [Alphaproteobacteria bacterium]